MVARDYPLPSSRPCRAWAGRFAFTANSFALRLADGRVYAGDLWPHRRRRMRWVGFVASRDADGDARLNADGSAAAGVERTGLWPLQVVLALSADGVCRGSVWIPDVVGRPGGEMLRLIARWGGPFVWKGVAVRRR